MDYVIGIVEQKYGRGGQNYQDGHMDMDRKNTVIF
jgi:hypothetical protein